jgi:DNA-binding protein
MEKEVTIFVGQKPPMRYVTAIITALNREGIESITLKARGRAISRAVDVAEITRNRFVKNLSLPTISIDTEQMPTYEGGTRGVSTVAITFNMEDATKEFTTPSPDRMAEAPLPSSFTLTDIKGVGGVTEEKLKDAGFETVKSIAMTKPDKISEKTGISSKTCVRIVEASKELLEQDR